MCVLTIFKIQDFRSMLEDKLLQVNNFWPAFTILKVQWFIDGIYLVVKQIMFQYFKKKQQVKYNEAM